MGKEKKWTAKEIDLLAQVARVNKYDRQSTIEAAFKRLKGVRSKLAISSKLYLIVRGGTTRKEIKKVQVSQPIINDDARRDIEIPGDFITLAIKDVDVQIDLTNKEIRVFY